MNRSFERIWDSIKVDEVFVDAAGVDCSDLLARFAIWSLIDIKIFKSIFSTRKQKLPNFFHWDDGFKIRILHAVSSARLVGV